MYELADWGRPVLAERPEPRQRVTVTLPEALVRILRSRARHHRVSLESYVARLLEDSLDWSRTGDIHLVGQSADLRVLNTEY